VDRRRSTAAICQPRRPDIGWGIDAGGMMTVMEIGELRMAQEMAPTDNAGRGQCAGESSVIVLGAAVRFFSDSFDVLCMEPARDTV
jgi:hypothetical protein